MHNMGLISGAMKELGNMAKGSVAFDADAANAALGVLRDEAGKTVALFEAHEDDPKSEARAEIWANFSDFTAKAGALEAAAVSVGAVASLEDVRSALGTLGQTCKACHKPYRE